MRSEQMVSEGLCCSERARFSACWIGWQCSFLMMFMNILARDQSSTKRRRARVPALYARYRWKRGGQSTGDDDFNHLSGILIIGQFIG